MVSAAKQETLEQNCPVYSRLGRWSVLVLRIWGHWYFSTRLCPEACLPLLQVQVHSTVTEQAPFMYSWQKYFLIFFFW